MNRIESIIGELNELCRDYINQQDRYRDSEKVSELFREMKSLGFTIVTPIFDCSSPEYQLLSENGKKDVQQISGIRKKKREAIASRAKWASLPRCLLPSPWSVHAEDSPPLDI